MKIDILPLFGGKMKKLIITGLLLSSSFIFGSEIRAATLIDETTGQVNVYQYETVVDFNNLYSLSSPVDGRDFNIPNAFMKQYKFITRYYIPHKLRGKLKRTDYENPRSCSWGACSSVTPYSYSRMTFADKNFKVAYELIDLSTGKKVGSDSAKLYLTSTGKSKLEEDFSFSSLEISKSKIYIQREGEQSFYGAEFYLNKKISKLKIDFDNFSFSRFQINRADKVDYLGEQSYQISIIPNAREIRMDFFSRGASLNTWDDFDQIVWVASPGRNDMQLIDTFVKSYKVNL